HWEACLNQEHAERARREKALEDRARAVGKAEAAAAEQQRQWAKRRAQLEKEAAGLESRVRNLRGKLAQAEAQLARTQARPAASVDGLVPPAPPPAVEEAAVPERLRHLSGELADQRVHLLEQWRALLAVHDRWQQERQHVVADLEEAVKRLDEREQRLAG